MTLLHPTQIHDVALLDEGLYAVLTEHDTLGFVQRVGNVFVALSGSDLGRAVEVGQTMSWQRAVDIVVAA